MLEEIKVIVISEPMIGPSIRSILENSKRFKIIHEVSTTSEALSQLPTDYDQVITTLYKPDIDKLIDIHVLRCHFNSAKFLVLTDYLHQAVLTYLYHIGVNACLPSKSEQKDFDEALFEINAHEIFVSECLANYLLAPKDSPFVSLSLKQMKIAFLLLANYSLEHISHKLHLNKNSLAKSKKILFNKLEIPNEESLIQLATEDGLLMAKH